VNVRHALLGTLKGTGIVIGGLVLALIVGSVILPPLLRGWYNRLGATDAEIEAVLPGDDLIAEATSSSTRAITIEAPYDLVHKLIVQMGYQRAGWYGWDWFYKATGSAEFVDGSYSSRVVPELQDLAVGDTVYINKAVGYEVVRIEPGVLVLFAAMAADGRKLEPNDPSAQSAMSWAWVAEPVDDDTTRLVLRIRNGGSGFGGFVGWLFDNPLDMGGSAFAYKTLAGLKRTAEDLAD